MDLSLDDQAFHGFYCIFSLQHPLGCWAPLLYTLLWELGPFFLLSQSSCLPATGRMVQGAPLLRRWPQLPALLCPRPKAVGLILWVHCTWRVEGTGKQDSHHSPGLHPPEACWAKCRLLTPGSPSWGVKGGGREAGEGGSVYLQWDFQWKDWIQIRLAV